MIAEWRTADNRVIPVGAMTDSHLRNTICTLQQGRRITHWPRDGFHRHEWIQILNAELTRRSRLS